MKGRPMSMLMLLMLQGAGAPPAQPMTNIDFDLRKVKQAEVRGSAIIVTGRRIDRRLEPLPDIPPNTVPRAETGIAGRLRGGVDLQQRTYANGTTGNAAMVTLKLPF
jgi:hypothetical protein